MGEIKYFMKILIFSQWYFPENVSGKINEIGLEFKKFGHNVEIITGYPNYPSGKLFKDYKIRFFFTEVINEIKVHRFPLYPYHGKNPLKRFLNYFSLLVSTLMLGSFKLRKIDAIYLYDSLLSMGIPALIFSKIFRIPLFFEIQDMYPETLSATRMINSNFILNAVNKLNLLICNNSKEIIVISKGFKDLLSSKGINHNIISIIPNWINEEHFYPVNADEELLKKYNLQNKLTIIYAGNLGIAQNLINFLYAVERLKEEASLKVLFIGDGNQKELLTNFVKEKKITNVIFIPYIDKNNISKYLSLADILLVHLKKDPIFEITIPSKTIAYFAVGKPILCVGQGEVAELINESNSGFVCAPDNQDELLNTLIMLLGYKKESLYQLGINSRKLFLSNFQKQHLIYKYKQIFHLLENNV